MEKGLDGQMVSIQGQLELTYVPFSSLVNPETLVTEVRFIERGSDFHQLARFLETRMDDSPQWALVAVKSHRRAGAPGLPEYALRLQ